jgi:hypothetical protein
MSHSVSTDYFSFARVSCLRPKIYQYRRFQIGAIAFGTDSARLSAEFVQFHSINFPNDCLKRPISVV